MGEAVDFTPNKDMKFPYPEPRSFQQRTRPDEVGGGGVGFSLLLRRPKEEECFCIEHGPSQESAYKRYLDRKDGSLYNRLKFTRDVMAARSTSIIDHPCPDIDCKMDVLYSIDYAKRGLSTDCYRQLAPATSCKVGTPLKPLRYSVEGGYRDPALLPFTPVVRANVDSIRPLNFASTPRSTLYSRNCTEYEDTISRMGMVNTRNTKFYLQPQPSSRLRPGDLTTAH